MRLLLRTMLAALFLGFAASANAQGTLPLALQQQFSFSGCSSTATTAACGQPLNGGLLYFYQVGTVATRQDSFQDTGLTIANQWPLVLDANGRVPAFYLASGSVHVRLTDAGGVVQFDVPSMLVIGPSGGGGGGSSVDPTTVAQTGDIKFRPTNDTLTGWVKLNRTTIGNATSGATQRANADTQALYVYLWTTFTQPSGNVYCAVSGGVGASALADFNASKAMTLIDMRGRSFAGLDGMGNSRGNVIADSNIQFTVSGGGADGLGAVGGIANPSIAQNQLPNVAPSFTGSAGTPTGTFSATNSVSYTPTGNNTAPTFTGNVLATHIAQSGGAFSNTLLSPSGGTSVPNCNGTCSDLLNATPSGSVSAPTWTASNSLSYTPTGTITMNSFTPAGTVGSINGNVTQQAFPTLGPFWLGTWYMKL